MDTQEMLADHASNRRRKTLAGSILAKQTTRIGYVPPAGPSAGLLRSSPEWAEFANDLVFEAYAASARQSSASLGLVLFFRAQLAYKPLNRRAFAFTTGSARIYRIDTSLATIALNGQDCLTMQTKVSTKGQVILPSPLRRRLDIRAGDPLDANIENGRIVLTPQRKRAHRVKLVTDPVTGLPALSAGPNAPTLSSKEVEEILAMFP